MDAGCYTCLPPPCLQLDLGMSIGLVVVLTDILLQAIVLLLVILSGKIVIAHSTAKAKYCAMVHIAFEMVWVCSIQDLDVDVLNLMRCL